MWGKSVLKLPKCPGNAEARQGEVPIVDAATGAESARGSLKREGPQGPHSRKRPHARKRKLW